MARSLVKDSAQVAASPISFIHRSYQRSFRFLTLVRWMGK